MKAVIGVALAVAAVLGVVLLTTPRSGDSPVEARPTVPAPTTSSAVEPVPVTTTSPATPTAATPTTTTPATTEPPAPTTTTTEPPPPFPLWDTAWELSFFAKRSEIDTYFDHLAANQFTGAWVTFFSIFERRGSDWLPSPIFGTTTGGVDEDDQFFINPEAVEQMRYLLDAAQSRGLQVGFVPIWENRYVNRDGDACFGSPSNIGNGVLHAGNSLRLGDHPAIAFWILGGDNFCQASISTEPADPDIWRNLIEGIRSTGATQPATYHTPPGADANPTLQVAHAWHADEPWVDFLSPQTGHCLVSPVIEGQLQALIASTDKPVLAAETKYESPTDIANFCGWVVGAEEIAADLDASLAAGVDGVVFGHWHRFSIGLTPNSVQVSELPDFQLVIDTFGSPGEVVVLDRLRPNR